MRDTSVKPPRSSTAIHASVVDGGAGEQGADRLPRGQEPQSLGRDTASPGVVRDPARHFALAVDGEQRGGAGEAAALGHDEELDIR